MNSIEGLPEFPKPAKIGLGCGILRYYTEDGVTVCRGDGTGAISFAFSQFVLSHDGQQAAFREWVQTDSHDEDDEPIHREILKVQNLNSRIVTTITPPMEIVDVAWSIDGNYLWLATGGSSPRRLYRVKSSGGSVEHIAAGVSPTPSPVGRWVAFYGLKPHGVHLADARTGESRYACPGQPHAWSPDGRYLALLDTVGSSWQLYCLDVRTSTVRHVAPHSPFSYWPTWLPDSQTLAFELCEEGCAGPPSVICWCNISDDDYHAYTAGPWDEHPRVHPKLGHLTFQRRDVVTKRDCKVIVRDFESGQFNEIGPGSEPEWLPCPLSNELEKP